MIDEYEHLALTLATKLPEEPARLRVFVTEQTPAVTATLRSRLGSEKLMVTELGALEAAPTSGPFAMSLDADGSLDCLR